MNRIIDIHTDGFLVDTGEDGAVVYRVHAWIHWQYTLLPQQAWTTLTRHFLLEEGVQFTGNLIASESTHVVMTTEIIGNHVTSHMNLLAIAYAEAHIHIEGIARVDEAYRNTHTRVDQTNILIGENVRVRGIPRLDIATDDIVGGHSCRIHRLGGDVLFYLESRGLSTDAAEVLLLNSEILRHLGTIPLEAREQYCSQIHKIISQK